MYMNELFIIFFVVVDGFGSIYCGRLFEGFAIRVY